MTKRLLAMTISMLLIISMFPVIALGTSVTLAINPDSATVGTSITASGIADPDEWVSIKVVDSSGSIVLYDAVKSKASGDYICTFKVPQVSPGTLTVVAGYGSNVANKPLTVVTSGDETVAVTGISLNKNNTSIVKDSSETLLATVTPANASNKAVTWTSNNEAVATVDKNGKVTGVSPGTAIITVMTVDGNKMASCTVTITKPVTATSGSTVTIEEDTPVTITVPKGVTNSTITVTQNVKLPLVEVKAETSLGRVEMAIPEGAKIVNAPADWKGTITLPEVKAQPSTAVSGAQQVNAVIEVGLPDKEITFDKAVRLLVPGQKGKSAGYIRNGEFTQITYTITKDDQETADKELVDKIRDGKVDVGNDLAIWTKHFTEFIAYTPATSEGSKSSGGGTSDSQTISPSGGTVNKAGAVVSFPAAAVKSNIKVTVKKLHSGIPAVSPEFKLVSDVYEITSDKNNGFKKSVTITLPFDRNKVDNDKYDVGIYCWNNKQWVILDEVKVDTAAGKVSGTVNHFSKFAVLAKEKVTPVEEEQEPIQEPTKPALKDITGHWAEANISKLVATGAVSGYPDGTFKPDNTISRAEFATILVKAFKLEAKDGKIFEDTANHWAKGYIATANANNIVSGYSDTNFGPDDIITREQMAVMIVKAAKLANAAEGKTFTDATQISDWAKEAIGIASSEGIISGYPDNTFKPKANATRAEAVTVIVKAL